jgi:vacuolar-type H+-ATPase subunit F/Vma7
MVQLRRGVVRVMEAQVHPLVVDIPRFIQMRLPLPPFKLMDQLQRGADRIREVQVRPPMVSIPRFIQLREPL